MANFKQELKIIEEQLEQLDEQIKSHCIAWAQEYAAKLTGDDFPAEISLLQTEIETLEKDQIAIEGIIAEREEIQLKQKNVKNSESEEIKSRSDFYQVLGRRAFELYKRGSLNESEGLDELFRPLLDWEDKIRNADNELYRIRSEEESGNMFRKLGTFLKKSSQSNIKKSAGDNLSRNYKKTGERLIEEGYFTEIAQSGLSDIYDEFQDKEEVSRKLKEEQDVLDKKLDDLGVRLEELCKNTRPGRALKQLEEDKEEREKELDSAFLRLGQSLYGQDTKGEPFRDLIDELNKQRETKNREKVLCLTEIRITELEEDLQKKVRERDQQQEKADKEKLKWESLRDQTAELEKKKSQLVKEREDLSPAAESPS